jgi:catechol 2,3-dioxygenase-like lactoylglutathione lyase family enzyme
LSQSLPHITLIVRDYDEAIAWFTGVLGFTLIENTYQPQQDKRWVLVAPPGTGDNPATFLLARPALRTKRASMATRRRAKAGFRFLHFGYGRVRPPKLGGVSCSSARRR